MISYKAVYTKTASKDIAKLDSLSKKKIGQKILHYKDKPLSHAKKLVHSSLGTYRWRVGNYHIVFDLDGSRRCYGRSDLLLFCTSVFRSPC